MIKKAHRNTPSTFQEELLLTVPDNLTMLTKDEYLMVSLTKENAELVKACIIADPAYQPKALAVVKRYFAVGDHSEKAYYDIIHQIAIDNSTRTSKESKSCLAAYCAKPEHHFLDKLKSGDPLLVDTLLSHLVENGFRKDKSLASKVCRYLNEWLYGGCAYTINDSVVRAILPYYLAYYKIDDALWRNKNLEKLSYIEFYGIYSALRDKVAVLDNHQLDLLIWYVYKNDGIRYEVAKALSKVL